MSLALLKKNNEQNHLFYLWKIFTHRYNSQF